MKAHIYTLLISLVFFQVNASSLTESIEKIRKESNLPALGGLLLKNGEVAKLAVTGNRIYGKDFPATTKDKFQLGSCTKAMTATLAAVLVKEGKLSWKTKVSKYFSNVHDSLKDLTLEHLLTHRGGITGNMIKFEGGQRWKNLWRKNVDQQKERQNFSEALLQTPAENPPGMKKVYSNGGYMIAGALMKRATGLEWEELIKEKLFKPLEMSSCSFGAAGDPNLKIPDQPWPHDDIGGRPRPLKPNYAAANPLATAPAGAVHCSLRDWSKFIQIHIDGYNGKSSIISKELFKKLHTAYPGGSYTFGGWIKVNRNWAKGETFTHTGSNTLNYSVVWMAPNINKAALVVTNFGGKRSKASMDKVVGLLLED